MINQDQRLIIALLSAEYPPQPGGLGDYTRQLGLALHARGHQVAVITSHNDQLLVLDVTAEPIPHVADPRAWRWSLLRTLPAALRGIQPDVLHIQYQTGAYGMHPAINFVPRRLRGQLPVCVTAHDLLPPYLFPKAGPVRRLVTEQPLRNAAAAIVTNAADAATLHQRGIHADIIPIGSNIAVVLGAGYDRAAWRARIGVRADELLIAYFGLISPSKGLDVVLAALAQLPPRIKLLIIGGAATAPQDIAYAATIPAQLARLGLPDRVQITGHVPPAAVSAHLLSADVAALPFVDGASFRRGSLLAALAHGVAVVTTADGGPTSDLRLPTSDGSPSSDFQLPTLDHATNCLLVPPGDAPALAAAITQLDADPALRARIAAGGKELAAHFDWRTIAEQHEALYRRVLNRTAA